MFSLNLMMYKRVTKIPQQSCFTGWEEIWWDLGRICDALHNLLSEACRRLKTCRYGLLEKAKQTAFF